jgi:hypothetical protein
MARAAVLVDDLERGDLPAICAKTGVPCDSLVRDTIRVVPPWVAALIYAAVVPFLVVRLYVSRRVEAKLPIAPGRVQRIRTLVRAAWIAMVIGAAGLASAVFGAGAIASRRPDVVILTRVHPAFASALAEQYEARAAAGRAALPAGY